MADYAVLRVGPGDAALLADLAPDVFGDPIDPALLPANQAHPAPAQVIARAGSRVIGQAMGAVHRHPDKAADFYVDEIAVSPAWRRRGIAKALLAEIEAYARDLGCADAWLATERGNEAARALYGSFANAKDCVLFYWDL
jgi:aminoglycoside 6'-N-acetyltransferase I